MDALAEQLDKKLQELSPETAEQVRCEVAELMELADHGVLDVFRSRKVEQEVLDLIDEPHTPVRSGWRTWASRNPRQLNPARNV
jgi:hypothetical protein